MYYSYDELLVGAPLFRTGSTKPEIGRVFLYRNVNVSFIRLSLSLSLSLHFEASLPPSACMGLTMTLYH